MRSETDVPSGVGTRRLTLRLRMLSDWHIGTGTGVHGHIDRRVQRGETDGLPFVPAKTLVGVWRDACEVAASALDSGPSGVWHGWVYHLFGSQPAHPAAEDDSPPDAATPNPRPATLRLHGSLRFPGRLGEVLAGRRLLHDAVTFIKPGVAIDPVTGAASEQMLRYEEVARAGLTLVGTAEIVGLELLTAEQRACALGLLWSGAVLVEGIGGKRRRGAGRCRLEPTGPGLPPELDRLERLAYAPVAPPSYEQLVAAVPDFGGGNGEETGPADEAPPAGSETGTDAEPAPGSGWERATISLTLGTPLLAHDRTVGNMVLGRDHVPGWLLLPAVLSRLGRDAEVAARRGDLVVTPATMLLDGQAARPVPRVLAHAKDDATRIVNRMAGTGLADGRADAREPGDGPAGETGAGSGPPDAVFERFRGGYIAADPLRAVAVRRPEFVVRMHNTVNDEVQRPTEDLGGVHVYQALAPGTELAAEVRVRAGLLPAGWRDRLTGTWRLGASRKDDYGLVAVAARGGPAGRALPAEVSVLETGHRIRVWLLSDTLVRNPRLGPSGDPADLARALARAFAGAGAVGAELVPVAADDSGMANAYQVSRTDSWHRGWRLPRPGLLGFEAGGCLTFELTAGRIGPDAIAEVELAGMGERRGEGFGQVCFNDPRLIRPASRADPARTSEGSGTAADSGSGLRGDPPGTLRPASPLTADEPGYEEARVIERAAWRAEIWRRSEKLAAASDGQVFGSLAGIGVNRLNTVRSLLNRLDEPPAVLHRRIDRLTARWASDRGPAAGSADTAAVKALKDLFTTENLVWELLDLRTEWLCLTDDAPGKLRADLRAEALRSLLTAYLAARARDDARGSDDGEGARS